MIKIMKAALCVLPISMAHAMQPLDEYELGEITGEGIGATFDNVVIHSKEFGQDDAFQIRLKLSDSSTADELILSGLQFYRSGASADINGGGRFGTYDDPFIVADLREITETHVGNIDPNGSGVRTPGSRTHTALYTGFPAADLAQKNRSFDSYTKNDTSYQKSILRNMDTTVSSFRGLPNGFFTNTQSVSVGNFSTLSSQYAVYLQEQEDRLDLATDKFDLSFRIDSKTAANRNLDPLNPDNNNPWLLAKVDLEGVRLYGTYAMLWAHSNQGELLVNGTNYQSGGAPSIGNRGLSMAVAVGFRADAIRISTDRSDGASGMITMNHVDAYLPLGSVDQPMTISTVQFQQTQRGTWKNPIKLAATTQLRLEIAALPQDVKQAPKGNIFIQSIAFGDSNDPDIITGKEDIYLRDSSGNIVTTVNDVAHRAFVPKTVIYNEQIALHNNANPNNKLPYIPNQNVIEIRGLEIQRLVITTQDL